MCTADTQASRLPSVAQMLNRCLPFHRNILRALASGSEIVTPASSDADWRGYRTAMQTLRRWQCIRSSVPRVVLTERGLDLLAALNARAKASDECSTCGAIHDDFDCFGEPVAKEAK